MKKRVVRSQSSYYASGNDHNSYGVASVVLGLNAIAISLVTGYFSGIAGFALGLIGVVFAFKQKNRGVTVWARSGLIISIIAIILGLTVYFLTINNYFPSS